MRVPGLSKRRDTADTHSVDRLRAKLAMLDAEIAAIARASEVIPLITATQDDGEAFRAIAEHLGFTEQVAQHLVYRTFRELRPSARQYRTERRALLIRELDERSRQPSSAQCGSPASATQGSTPDRHIGLTVASDG